MRGILLLAVLVLIMILVGWVTFSSNTDRTTINIETQKIESDTQDAIQRGRELIKEAEQGVDEAAENLETPPQEKSEEAVDESNTQPTQLP